MGPVVQHQPGVAREQPHVGIDLTPDVVGIAVPDRAEIQRQLAQEVDHRFRMNGRRISLRHWTLSVFPLSPRLLHRLMKKMLTGHA